MIITHEMFDKFCIDANDSRKAKEAFPEGMELTDSNIEKGLKQKIDLSWLLVGIATHTELNDMLYSIFDETNARHDRAIENYNVQINEHKRSLHETINNINRKLKNCLVKSKEACDAEMEAAAYAERSRDLENAYKKYEEDIKIFKQEIYDETEKIYDERQRREIELARSAIISRYGNQRE